LPSFINDVAEHFGAFVNDQSAQFASGVNVPYPMFATEGGKEALLAEMAEFSLGSDHQIYSDSSFGVPSIYLNDWPDRYIHTNSDVPANVDATKLKRAAFIGAASAYYLANLKANDAAAVLRVIQANSLRRTSTMLARRAALSPEEGASLTRYHVWRERAVVESMDRFFRIPEQVRADANSFLSNVEKLVGEVKPSPPAQGDSRLIFRRNANLKGPMSAFGYDYFTDHYGAERERAIRLLEFQGLRGSGGDYSYEVLNLVNGRRTAQEIRDVVSAVYGPIPLEMVVEYLKALESIRAIEAVR
jgi:hypothetical protein